MKKKVFLSDRAIEKKIKRQDNPAFQNSVFAATLGQNQPDRSYFKKLYLDTRSQLRMEIDQYNLPFFKTEEEGKVPSGVINATQLPPLHPTGEEDEEEYEEEEVEREGEEEYNEGVRGDETLVEPEDFMYEHLKGVLEKVHEENNRPPQSNFFLEKGTDIYETKKTIITGEHAIAFFAKHGNSTAIKFIDCVLPEEAKDNCRPYDLQVKVKINKKFEEHFTISAQGVVHVCPKKGANTVVNTKDLIPTEFFTLSDWMREATMFNVLRSMNFFKHYLSGKIFNLWQGIVRYHKYKRTRAWLSKRLLYSRQAFVDTFMTVNKHLYEMQIKKTFDIRDRAKNLSWERDEFNTEQIKVREVAKTEYDKKMEIINNKLYEVSNEVEASRNIKDDEELDHNKIGQKIKTKSMVKMKEEEKLVKECKRLAEKNCENLGQFIRLVDYMEVETLVKINQDSLDEIYSQMSLERKNGITTKINYGEKGEMNFTHNGEIFWDLFEAMIKDMISTVTDVTRVISHPKFKDHLPDKGGAEFGPVLQTIIEQSNPFRSTKTNIKIKIDTDMTDCSTFANNTFNELRAVEEFKNTWNFDNYKTNDHTTSDLKEKLETLKGWKKRIGRVNPHYYRGLIYATGQKLTNSLKECSTQAYDNIKEYLADKTMQKADTTIVTLEDIATELDIETKEKFTLNSFCEFVENLRKAERVKENLEKARTKVEKMSALLRKHASKDDSIRTQITNINVKIETLNTLLINNETIQGHAQNEETSKKDHYKEALEKQLADLKVKVKEQTDLLDEPRLCNEESEPEDCLNMLDRIQHKYETLKNYAQKLNDYQKTLDPEEDPKKIRELMQFEKHHDARNTVWKKLVEWREKGQSWFNDNFKDIDIDIFAKDMADFERICTRLKQELNKTGQDPVLEKLTSDVFGMKEMAPVIQALGNKALKERHWQKIFKLLGDDFTWSPGKTFTLTELISAGIMKYGDEVSEIGAMASGEYMIEHTIEEIKNIWNEMYFTVINYRDMKDRFILGSIDEIYLQLDEDQMQIQAMQGSKYVIEIRKPVDEWEKKLNTISETLDEWLNCQKQWMYLENIFSAADIQQQLPKENAKFQKVDKFWRDQMTRTNKNKLIVDISDGLKAKFESANEDLEDIQKCLENYLETKRRGFSRFYFLSNDELLEILSQTRRPQAVQPHLQKCFDSIHHIEFSPEKDSIEILGMHSQEGEYVSFSKPVFAEGNVEFWLQNIERAMNKTLYDLIKGCIVDYPKNGLERKTWFFTWPAQCVLNVDQVIWTKNCGQAIVDKGTGGKKDALNDFFDFSKAQIGKMTEMVRGTLAKLERTLTCALCVLDVHSRDVTEKLIKKDVYSIQDFEWTRQLRYYWSDPLDTIVAKQTNCELLYGYEYLGNSDRLVITPLTDKCYMTLTGAIHLKYGGNPQGPAGTGKTETVKDLAKVLAIQCVVFNCSDGLDYKTMGRFFSGLAQSGAWSCFDEFNRIEIEVLSVIATQILTIQTALKAKLEEFEFEGRIIPLNARFGVFITMNPGYAGRTELPDNLKALFRPIAMMIPDYALIAEIILFSEGFGTAQSLARKMVQLYKLSSEQLSKQDHYDFGMRAVKSVLVMAGALRRKNPDTEEDIVLIRAMRDSNVPKFLQDDLVLFGGIINDLFPGIDIPYIDYGKLAEEIKNQLDKKYYMKLPPFIIKIIQLLETLIVRHGIMMVGETGTGKTTVIHTLRDALTALKKGGSDDPQHEVIKTFVLNPKSITPGKLFGMLDTTTNEWHNGIVPKLVQKAIEDATDDKKWIVFDGPVDTLWIESMNTVLDDSKMLCLANGQRIKLPLTIAMLFEVQDLRVASPATVSRCGMVFLEPIHLGWEPIVDTWALVIKARAEDPDPDIKEKYSVVIKHVDFLHKNLKKYLGEAIKCIREDCKEVVPSVDTNLVQSCLNLFDSLIFSHNIDWKKQTKQDQIILLYFLFAFIWSMGANIEDSTRHNFNDFFTRKVAPLYDEFPEGEDISDYYVDLRRCSLSNWKDKVKDFKYKLGMPYFKILVPTTDTVKYKFVIDTLLTAEKNVLLLGETGVGKSVIIQDYLAEDSEIMLNKYMNFSAKTTARNFQDLLETLKKKTRGTIGPPGGKQMVFFIDDVNMPQYDRFGSQPPVELLRQAIGQGGFYDLKKLELKKITNTSYITSCAPPGGGRNVVTPRLFRYFNMLWMPNLSERSMETIFTSILKGFLEASPRTAGLSLFSNPIVHASVEIYTKIIRELLPTPTKSHYTFNLRDLSKVIQGLLCIAYDYLRDKHILVKLWLHETSRVFRDRLTNDKDAEWFNETVGEKLKDHLQMEWKDSYKDINFTSYHTEENTYEEVTDEPELLRILTLKLELYNSECISNKMLLVFFKDAIEHLSRASRILHQQRGNALLVGSGGSGRQSMARMAAFMAEFDTFQIKINKDYREKEFHEDVMTMLKKVGEENQEVMFLFSDTQIVFESFLEDINNILNTGEVPNLWKADERENIIEEVRAAAKVDGKETKDAIFQFFINRCRENLHVVLAFSPVGEQFRNRCRQFPSIINCCTIDWYNQWPNEALHSVAERKLVEETTLGIGEYTEQLCQMAVKIHSSVAIFSEDFYQELRRRVYTTPTSYLELLKMYIELLKEQKNILPQKIRKYKSGLKRMKTTNEIVDGLKQKLIVLKPKIDKKEADAKELVIVLNEQKEVASVKEKVCEKDTTESMKIYEEVTKIKDECESKLAEAMPIYKKAIAALNTLDVKDIQEMKAYNNPPKEIGMVISAVCLLMGQKETWEQGKKLMGEPKKFIDGLKNYPKEKLTPQQQRKLQQRYIKLPEFEPENIKKKSLAAQSICMWCIALDKFVSVYKEIEPKQKALEISQKQLNKAKTELAIKQKDLQEVRDKIATLQANHAATQRKLDEYRHKKEEIEIQLERAEKLLGGLADESARWLVSVEKLDNQLFSLVGDVLVCAGLVCYAGPFTAKYREKLLKEWLDFSSEVALPRSEGFMIAEIMTDPVTIREWNMAGLPGDNLSIENGIFMTSTHRWPLMIDPQGQANRWVKNMEKDNNLQVIKLSDPKKGQYLMNGIRLGQPVLLENIKEFLDPLFEPVLQKQVYKTPSGQYILKMGDDEVPYSQDFSFYITTKLHNPHYLPEISIKVTLINFTVTPDGLEEQLLVDVVKFERPELEKNKDDLIINLAEFNKELRDIEDRILKMVAEASDDILNDEDLINTLEQSKFKSIEINDKKKEAEEMMDKIKQTRMKYSPVAVRGSVLYFVIADLAGIDPMYQYSLEFFTKLFNRRLKVSDKAENVEARIEILIKDITKSFYENICRGLFEKHKLLFSFLNTVGISRREKVVSNEEWNFLLRGSNNDYSAFPFKGKWDLDILTWYKVMGIEETHYNFRDLSKSFANEKDCIIWQSYIKSDDPVNQPLPSPYEENLSNFQRLMIQKILREETLISGIVVYITKELGQQYVEVPPFDLEGAFLDSTCTTPIIFILSPGADPVVYLMNLARKKEMETRIRIKALGQGQGPIAAELIDTCKRSGEWVCLQNCHLAASWMANLERIQEIQNEEETHPEYRLWLTSMPSNDFPVPVLQSGIKLTNEPPRGLKNNLARTFMEVSEDQYESCTKPRAFKKLLFALGFFHAVILERRKFGAIGWNIPYDWMNSDFETSLRVLNMYLDEQDEIPYDALNYLIAAINYGGRVTDDKDTRLITSILINYFTPEILHQENYRLSPLDLYYVPEEGTMDELKLYINSLPLVDEPEVFGLHSNASITFQQNTVRDVLDTIVAIQPRMTGKGAKHTPEEIVENMAKEFEYLVPKVIDKNEAHESTFADKQLNCRGVFIGQELDRFNVLIEVMAITLKDLQKAIKGLVVMSMELEEMFQAFIDKKVPKNWSNVAYLSLKPLAPWFKDFQRRAEFLQDWVTNGPPKSFWVPCFFFPQGFMTATLQTYARKTSLPIDTLMFKTSVRDFTADDIAIVPSDGVNIHGLFLDGAYWNAEKKLLVDSIPGKLFVELPCMWLEPVSIETEFKETDYMCPVYKTSDRRGMLSTTGHSTNFVLFLNLPSLSQQEYWIRRGVAFLCLLDD